MLRSIEKGFFKSIRSIIPLQTKSIFSKKRPDMPEAFFEDTSLIKDLPNLFTKFNYREEFPQNLTEEEKQKLKRFDIYR
jgi:hypothetical protein